MSAAPSPNEQLPLVGRKMDTISSNDVVSAVLLDANSRLSRALGADILAFRSPMRQPLDDIIRDEVEGIKSSGKSKDKIVVLVETTGGFIETVERIVSVLRRHYTTVEFIVPNYAYSAGTVLVLSGDEIHLDYYSVLGPIDPQYESDTGDYVPGMGYLAKFEELMAKINDPTITDPNLVRGELAYLVKKFDPARLFHIEQAIEHSKSLLIEWLPRYKFKDWHTTETNGQPVTDQMKKDRAEQIAGVLGDAKRWHSHGRGITIKELESEDIKLKVRNFGDDPKLNEAIRHYYGLFVDYIQRLGMKSAVHSRRGLRRTA